MGVPFAPSPSRASPGMPRGGRMARKDAHKGPHRPSASSRVPTFGRVPRFGFHFPSRSAKFIRARFTVRTADLSASKGHQRACEADKSAVRTVNRRLRCGGIRSIHCMTVVVPGAEFVTLWDIL